MIPTAALPQRCWMAWLLPERWLTSSCQDSRDFPGDNNQPAAESLLMTRPEGTIYFGSALPRLEWSSIFNLYTMTNTGFSRNWGCVCLCSQIICANYSKQNKQIRVSKQNIKALFFYNSLTFFFSKSFCKSICILAVWSSQGTYLSQFLTCYCKACKS